MKFRKFAIAFLLLGFVVFGTIGCGTKNMTVAPTVAPTKLVLNNVDFDLHDGLEVTNSSGGGTIEAPASERSTDAKVGGKQVALESEEETQGVEDE